MKICLLGKLPFCLFLLAVSLALDAYRSHADEDQDEGVKALYASGARLRTDRREDGYRLTIFRINLADPANLKRLLALSPKVTQVDLRDEAATPENIRGILEIPSLRVLEISKPKDWTAHCLDMLDGGDKLEELRLRRMPFTDAELRCLASFKSLKTLELKHLDIAGEGLVHLSKLTRLKRLAVVGDRFDTTSLRFLKAVPELTRLTVGGKEGSQADEDILPLHALTKLEWLRLENLTLTNAQRASLKQAIPQTFIVESRADDDEVFD